MRRSSTIVALSTSLLAALSAVACGRTIQVSPTGAYSTISQALAVAANGDRLVISPGVYFGPIVVEKSISLIGRGRAVLDGRGSGTVLTITAPNVTIQGMVIRNSGDTLDQENSGITIEAPGAVVENNKLEDTLFGIYLQKANGSIIRSNTITSKPLVVPRRGDPIRIWYSTNVHIEKNQIFRGRDVVLWYSKGLTVQHNKVQWGRYGLHFMYCDDAHIENNLLINNSVGAFLMYSRRLRLIENTIAYNKGPSGYGVGLKDIDDAIIHNNLFLDNRVGAYIDNSPRDVNSKQIIKGNVFAYNNIGIGILPGVERNHIYQNSFIDNREQVQIEGGGTLRGNLWTVGRDGNYWSDYAGYDADHDGTGDIPYRAQRLFENLTDRYPVLAILNDSPLQFAIDFAARALPIVQPEPKLTDTTPILTPRIAGGLPALPQAPIGPMRAAVGGLLASAIALIVIACSRLDSMRLPSRQFETTILKSEQNSIISLENVTKRYGSVAAVDNVSLTIMQGEVVALWGPNGAGKTTILRCLLGLFPFNGTVRIGGYNVSFNGRSARELIGFVPQELSFHDRMSVRETLDFYARIKRTPAARTEALLNDVGLTAHSKKLVRALSGGMKQRLALACALLADPPILILDEPTSNLDAEARRDFLGRLKQLKAAGKTLVFSSHRVDDVLGLATRVITMRDGKVIGDGNPSQMIGHVSGATLQLDVAEKDADSALKTLLDAGYEARKNGQRVSVHVGSRSKGAPVHLLLSTGISVEDFDLEIDEMEINQ